MEQGHFPSKQPDFLDDEIPLRVNAPPIRDVRLVLRSRPVRSALWLVALGLCVQWLPGAEAYRLWSRPHVADATPERGLLRDEDQREGSSILEHTSQQRPDLAEVTVGKANAKGPIAAPRVEVVSAGPIGPSPIPILDPSGSLNKFYAALSHTAARTPNAITRILYHGDSIVASDYVTGTLRRAFQSEFGDAGHGFVLMADAWPSYFHNDISRLSTRGFEVSRVVGPFTRDGLYGLGGVSFVSSPGVRARVGTAEKGEYGRRVSRFEIRYLEHPGGGELTVLLDGAHYTTISTHGDVSIARTLEVKTSDGAHQIEVFTQSGRTRTFGVILEREVPGVVLDAIGIQGARIRFLDKQDDDHWAEQLRSRKPHLLVFQFGGNESADGFAYPMTEYHQTMAAVLRQATAAVPDAGCLVLATMDQGKKEGNAVITRPIIPHIVREQEAVAKEVGCAFWNTYEAMGGYGSMAIWAKRGLGQADLAHPSGWGAQVIGNWLYGALMHGYHGYLHGQDSSRYPATTMWEPRRTPIPPPTNEIPPLKQRE